MTTLCTGPFGRISRRSAIGSTLLPGAAFLAAPPTAAQAPRAASVPGQAVRHEEVDQPVGVPLPAEDVPRQCLQLAKDAGFDGIELNYDLESICPQGRDPRIPAIRSVADRIGIAISGLCSFLFWPFPLTSNDPAKRTRGLELAGKMAHAAHDLGVENLLVVPGAVHIPWRDDHEPVPNDVCDRRAREAVGPWRKPPKN